jgi:hypothetical protein
MADKLRDVSTAALVMFALSGGCDGDPGVSDENALKYARGIEAEMPHKKKEGIRCPSA